MDPRRIVTLTSTGPDGIVVEVEVSVPPDCRLDALRSRLDAATEHVVTAYKTGAPVDVQVDDAWLSVRVVR